MTAPAAEYPEESAELSEPSTADAPNSDVPVTSDEGGVLILGGTPIGNLADASDRLRSALATADLIAVEDTRKLRTLASGLGVRTRGRVIVNHDHNEEGRSATIVQAVQDGQRVLLLSDAGMPARALRPAHRPLHLRRVPGPKGLRAFASPRLAGGGGTHHDLLRVPAPHRRDPR